MKPVDDAPSALTAAPAAAAFAWTEAEAQQAHAAGAGGADGGDDRRRSSRSSSPRHEYATVGCWSTSIIPKDERSGSATDAGVPEFMDFMMIDQPARQTAMRGGLAWLDRECVSRFDKTS